MKMYELTEAYQNLMELDLEPEQLQEALASIQGDIAEKAENIAKAMRTMELEENALTEEINRLQAMVKTRKNRRESLKSYLDMNLKAADVKKLEAGTFKFSYRKSTSVKIADEDAIPEEYKTEKVTVSVSKNDIKKALNNGVVIPGAELEEKQNLQIK